MAYHILKSIYKKEELVMRKTLRRISYYVQNAILDIKIWILLRFIYVGALITKKQKYMQMYHVLNYKFHRS